jgi:tetratricopeptide (TPR) repeat protein
MADTGRLDELKRKFEENPKRYFAPLANEYRKAGDAEMAIELCRTYLPQQPTHMSGYIVYGQALHDAGHIEESAAVFKQALTLDPENIIALRHLGDIGRDAGDNVGAMRWYGKVLELDPRNEEILAYFASVAHPGSQYPAHTPERHALPAIRPEPVHDESAVRLEDIVSQPDMAQMPLSTEERLDAPIAQTEMEPVADEPVADEPVADEPVADEPVADEPVAEDPIAAEPVAADVVEEFQVTEWPLALDQDVPDVPDAPDLPAVPEEQDWFDSPPADLAPIIEGPWHTAETPVESIPPVPEPEEEAAPLHLADNGPEQDVELAPSPLAEELGESEPEPAAEISRAAAQADVYESPFVTETMAELYVRQGLREEALDIYRQLLAKRDDPALRARVAELEAEQPVKASGETVREFFARIGIVRPAERIERAADRGSPLSALFGSANQNPDDLNAARRLSGAFGNSRLADAES